MADIDPRTTPAPVTIMVPLDLMQRIVSCLAECSDDLQCEIDGRYLGSQDKYPTEMRRYQRDIRPVTRARELLAEWSVANAR